MSRGQELGSSLGAISCRPCHRSADFQFPQYPRSVRPLTHQSDLTIYAGLRELEVCDAHISHRRRFAPYRSHRGVSTEPRVNVSGNYKRTNCKLRTRHASAMTGATGRRITVTRVKRERANRDNRRSVSIKSANPGRRHNVRSCLSS